MESKVQKQILKSILRALIATSFFIILSKISFLIFKENLFGEEEHYSKLFFNIYNFLFSMLIFFSTSYTFVLYDVEARNTYHERNSVIKMGFWIKFATSISLFLLLPITMTFDYVGGIFLNGVESDNLKYKLYTMLIMSPILFVLTLMSYRSAARQWRLEKDKDNKKKQKFIKSLFNVAVVYIFASIGIPWLLPFFLTLFELMKHGYGIFIGFLILVIGGIVGVFVYCYTRALCKRIAFLKQLNRLCQKDGVIILKKCNPYLSFFKNKNGFHFTIEKNEKRYDCKFIAGIFKNSPIIFSDQGNGIRQHTIRVFSKDLLHFMTRIDFAFDSENKRILIVLPIPLKIYASTKNSKPRPADVGELVGNYHIYNSSGFLNALERDCL